MDKTKQPSSTKEQRIRYLKALLKKADQNLRIRDQERKKLGQDLQEKDGWVLGRSPGNIPSFLRTSPGPDLKMVDQPIFRPRFPDKHLLNFEPIFTGSTRAGVCPPCAWINLNSIILWKRAKPGETPGLQGNIKIHGGSESDLPGIIAPRMQKRTPDNCGVIHPDLSGNIDPDLDWPPGPDLNQGYTDPIIGVNESFTLPPRSTMPWSCPPHGVWTGSRPFLSCGRISPGQPDFAAIWKAPAS